MENKKYLDIAIIAAKEAGRLLMDQINNTINVDDLSNPSIKQDQDSELLILKIIKESFPNHGFLGEEFGQINPESNYKWIIDPIDGTNNYTGGRDSFSVSIGLEKDKEIIIGVVYLPKRDELFYASKGEGSYLNEKMIKVSNQADISKAVITYSTYPGQENKTKILDEKIINSVPFVKFFGFFDIKNIDQTFGRGSMAAEFCYLACGRIDGVIRLKQKPWDVAAGSIIVKEAGAMMNNLQGENCSMYEGDFIAANPSLLTEINKIVLDSHA